MNKARKFPDRFGDPIIKARFWSKIAIRNKEACWIWSGSKNKNGYGQILIQVEGSPWTAKTHRLSFFYHTGIDPFDKLVCHRCDNPPCCNPHHLFLGNPTSNSLDAQSKGRLATGLNNGRHTHPESTPRGSKRWSAKLSEEAVLEIRRIHKEGELGCRRLAVMFGVRSQTILAIIHRKTWVHI